MHFIISTLGSAGDVFPFLGLALELRHRGHSITFATNAHFEPIITSHGLAFEALGSEDDYFATIRNPDLWSPRKAFPHIFRSLQPILRKQYDICAPFAGRSDALSIANVFGFGALLAQEKLGLRAITVHLQPAAIWSRFAPPTILGLFGPNWLKNAMYNLGEKLVIDPVVCPFLNSWRSELGLPPVRRISRWWNSPYGVLCMFPEWYAKPQPDWPANLMQTDFPLWNNRSSEPLDPALSAFLDAGPPPLVFTPGTANVHGHDFFKASVAACEHLKQRGILLTSHPEQIPDPLPDSIRHVRYVPLDRLLPRAAAFVHHGGIGSMSQALLAGIPQVIMPLAHDQFDNAARVEKLGVGQGLPVKKFTTQNLVRTLNPLLNSQEVTTACRKVSQRLHPQTGLTHSADAILKHASMP